MRYIEAYIFLTLLFTANAISEYLPDDCGRTRYDNRTERIVNGREANIGQFPWIVQLGIYYYRQLDFYCGGSLINRFYVISAAHCDMRFKIIRVGEYDASNDGKDCDPISKVCSPPHQDIPIKQIMRHPKFCKIKVQNDFSLIEMEKPAKLNDFVQPICLPKEPLKHNELYDSYTNIAGWGYIRQSPDRTAEILMHISAPIVKEIYCYDILRIRLLDSQWCIGYPKGKDSCQGDSGGPVSQSMTVNGKKRWYLFGLVSYGEPRCGTGPAVYTDVSRFLDWVKSKIAKA